MAGHLGTDHRVVHCSHEDIGAACSTNVIWHTEMPILRTAPAPMYLLSQLVHQHGLKVVLTGEGADECLAGYNVFKEMKVRRFWAKRPEFANAAPLARTAISLHQQSGYERRISDNFFQKRD